MRPLSPISNGSDQSGRNRPASVDTHKNWVADIRTNTSAANTSVTKQGSQDRQNVFAETSKSLPQQAPAALGQSQNTSAEVAESETGSTLQDQGLKRLGPPLEDPRGRLVQRLEYGSGMPMTPQLPSLGLPTSYTAVPLSTEAPVAVSQSFGSPFEEIVPVTRDQMEQRFNFGEASGRGLNCLLHSLKQLQTLNRNYPADAQEVADLRDDLQMLGLVQEGQMIDLMGGANEFDPNNLDGTAGDRLANRLGVRIQALVSSAASVDEIIQATAGPVFGRDTNRPLLSVLTYGGPGDEHFIPLWPKPLATQTSQPQSSYFPASQTMMPDRIDQRAALFAQASQARPTDPTFMQMGIGGPHDAMPLPPLYDGQAAIAPEEGVLSSLPNLPENMDEDWDHAEKLSQLQQMDDATEVSVVVTWRKRRISVNLSKFDIVTILNAADQHQAEGADASKSKKDAAVEVLDSIGSNTWDDLPVDTKEFKRNLVSKVIADYAPHITNPKAKRKPVAPAERKSLPAFENSMTQALKNKMSPEALNDLTDVAKGAERLFHVDHNNRSYTVSLDRVTIAFLLNTAIQHQVTGQGSGSSKREEALTALNNIKSQTWQALPVKAASFKRKLITQVIARYLPSMTKPTGRASSATNEKPVPDYITSMTEGLKSKMEREALRDLEGMAEGEQRSFNVKHRDLQYAVSMDRKTIAFLLNTADQCKPVGSRPSLQKKYAAVRALNECDSEVWKNLPNKDRDFKISLVGQVVKHYAPSITSSRRKG